MKTSEKKEKKSLRNQMKPPKIPAATQAPKPTLTKQNRAAYGIDGVKANIDVIAGRIETHAERLRNTPIGLSIDMQDKTMNQLNGHGTQIMSELNALKTALEALAGFYDDYNIKEVK